MPEICKFFKAAELVASEVYITLPLFITKVEVPAVNVPAVCEKFLAMVRVELLAVNTPPVCVKLALTSKFWLATPSLVVTVPAVKLNSPATFKALVGNLKVSLEPSRLVIVKFQ